MQNIQPDTSRSPGVYIHIPFCRRKCRYCDFYSIPGTEMMSSFFKALEREMTLAPKPPVAADSLYLGGGTPSLLSAGRLEKVLGLAAAHFRFAPDTEISVEINPGTVTAGKLRDYAALGCNRLNIGIQSFDDGQLAFLGRIHDAREALNAFRQARSAGFDDIGIDLIYGLPGQKPNAWRRELETAIGLQPEHISCYILSYEPGTALHADRESRKITPLDEARVAELFRLTHGALVAAGYEHYEISNFARHPDRRSRHNQKYWNFNTYVGLGPAAHSYDDDLKARSWNHADLTTYLCRLAQGFSPVCDHESLSHAQQTIEAVYLGLRQADGIDPAIFRQRLGIDFDSYFRNALEAICTRDWLKLEQGRWRATLAGMLFLDRMVGELIDRID